MIATALLEYFVRSHRPLVASKLTRFERLAGARPNELDQLANFFGVIDWVPVTDEIARRAGAFARGYRRSHSGIGAVDCLLAGTASALSADLVTTNVRHFPMFAGLRPPYHYDDGAAR